MKKILKKYNTFNPLAFNVIQILKVKKDEVPFGQYNVVNFPITYMYDMMTRFI